MNRFIQSFTQAPKQLFRVNTGAAIRLRAHAGPARPPRSFDLLTTAGKVKPKALNPAFYEFPNGASMRPNTAAQHKIVRASRGPTYNGYPIYVYVVPEGTVLPDDLILVHEFGDHFSMQARKEMTVEELNDKITDFLSTKGQRFTKDEWLQRYPRATEDRNGRQI